MEFTHELKELYADKIVEVRGNADALTVILNAEVDINEFKVELKKKFIDLIEPQTLFIRHADKQNFETLILK